MRAKSKDQASGRLAPAQPLAEKGRERRLGDDLVADASLIDEFISAASAIDLADVAQSFGISKSEFAESLGIARETFYKRARAEAPKTQARLREMLEILHRISAWAGGRHRALAWYRAQPLAAFGGRTAESLVKTGNASALRDYLDHIALGGYA
jgi:hypothetical protein